MHAIVVVAMVAVVVSKNQLLAVAHSAVDGRAGKLVVSR